MDYYQKSYSFFTNQIRLKEQELKQIENDKDKSLDLIKNYEKYIENTSLNIFEKIIRILTFGSINYQKKYHDIIQKYKKDIKDAKTQLLYVNNKINELLNGLSDIQTKLEKVLQDFREQLIDFQIDLLKASKYQYINDYTRVEYQRKLDSILKDNHDFLEHEIVYHSIAELINFYRDSKKWVTKSNETFIEEEKVSEKKFFDTIEPNPLTETQRDAILVNENNNLVLAGAGSGKTSVIVAKVIYLIKKEVLQPHEVLILAFNTNAKKELEERFKKRGIDIQINTFHSFGLNIIAQALNQKPSLCQMAESENNMSKFIKDSIQNLMVSMGPFLEKFIEFIAYFSIPYKNEFEFNSLGEYYEYQDNYDMKTLKHKVGIKAENDNRTLITLKEETVKSFQELMIANFLTLNGIRYLYETRYEHPTYSVEKRQYNPDFYLPDYQVYIEHFGINKKNETAPYIDKHNYLKDMEWKRKIHKRNDTALVETFSYEYTEGNLLERLKEKLLEQNVLFRELEFAEITELLKEPIENNRFTKLFTTFLNHYKSNMYSLDDLKVEAKEVERTSLFLRLFELIFNEYQKVQKRYQCIDFNDMIVEALHAIRDNQYNHRYKHIFIDEFQDISTTRAKLIAEILPINNTSVTAVGDDWQAINRFAGGNIKIIQDFEKIFGISKIIKLDYTFRFNDVVAQISSDFIEKNPHQIKKEIKTIKKQKQNKFSILLYWTDGSLEEDLKKILDLISKKENESSKQVMILGRYNYLLKKLRRLEKQYENLNIIFSTVHSSKGNEADYVVILNLNRGKYGFPSKIENDPILDIVIPEGDEFEDAEERRLFYVALTRTKETIFLLSDLYYQSTFTKEFIENYKSDIFFINDPENKPTHCPKCKAGYLKKRSTSKNDYFYGCSNFPRCDYMEAIPKCPICSSDLYRVKKGKIIKCTKESCNFEAKSCMKCKEGYMIERENKKSAESFLGCSKFPWCTHAESLK